MNEVDVPISQTTAYPGGRSPRDIRNSSNCPFLTILLFPKIIVRQKSKLYWPTLLLWREHIICILLDDTAWIWNVCPLEEETWIANVRQVNNQCQSAVLGKRKIIFIPYRLEDILKILRFLYEKLHYSHNICVYINWKIWSKINTRIEVKT